MMFTPPDVIDQTKKYHSENGGICGQSCLAVITLNSIQSVIDQWHIQFGEFKGWSGWKELRQYLEARGFKVKQVNNLYGFEPTFSYIARVQWYGEEKDKSKPFYGWKHWTLASAHTHFIVIQKGMFFCNNDGWGHAESISSYLGKDGVITSFLEVSL
jgi:hypothetical protein